MALTLKRKYKGVPETVYSDGTYLWVGMNNGMLIKTTIATPATSPEVLRFKGIPLCMIGDGTYLYVGLSNGQLLEITISSLAISVLERTRHKINALTLYSTTLTVALDDGNTYYRTVP